MKKWLRTKDGQSVHLNRSTLRRALSYAKPYRWQVSLLLSMILTSTVLGLLRPLIFRDLIDNTIPNQDLSRLNVLAIGLLFIPLLGGVMRVWQSRLNATVGEGVIFDLRVSLYSHLQRMPLRFFTNTKTGELMSRLNNDVNDARQAINTTIIDTVNTLIQLLAVLGVMFVLDWRLTLAGLAILPVFIPLSKRSSDLLRQISRDTMNTKAEMSVLMHETLNISGVLLVKLFGRRGAEIERFTDKAANVRDIAVNRSVVSSQFNVIVGLVSAVGTALVYWIGGYLVLKGVFTIGTVIAFSTYLSQFYGTLQKLSGMPISFATSMVSFERVFEVIDLPTDIPEKENAINLETVQGELEFQDVSFVYRDQDEYALSKVERHGQAHNVETALSGYKQEDNPLVSQARESALDHVSFLAKPGQMIALVGPSGAGKTTLTYLIPRLYDPIEGSIFLDGYNLRDISLESLAHQIGMVTQETHLFHDTIKMNLLYANLEATQSDIETACQAANIHNFIVRLPHGYNTIVGERGYRLSGGEKQRIAIARVILKNPRILVLDEATSHLDSQSETLIQEALKIVMKNRTSIVIAHRLSTILEADQILVMNRGRVVESGTHMELLAQNGLYAQLYETQFRLQSTTI